MCGSKEGVKELEILCKRRFGDSEVNQRYTWKTLRLQLRGIELDNIRR